MSQSPSTKSSSKLDDKQDLRDLTLEETRAFVGELGLERFRADQIFRWVHGRAVDSVDEMTNLTKVLRAKLGERSTLSHLGVDVEQISRDGTRKLRLKTHDDRVIETVLIPDGDASAPDDDEGEPERAVGDEFRGGKRPVVVPEHLQHALFPQRPKLTQCVSSQVGCALDCTFCATAKLGFGRNLTAGEIVDQVYRADRLLAGLPEDDPTHRAGADHITNIVFMGMGEPLHNYANVVRSLVILTDPAGAAFSRRRITVSTAGLVPAIEKLAKEPVQVNLAVSLNATTDEVRNEIMPINRKWNIARLLEAVRKVPLERRRRVTFEYVLLDGVNDTVDDARRLAQLVRGIPCKVNVIPWNPHEHSPYRRPTDSAVKAFQSELKARGLAVYVRRSRGDDIDAACGQLAAKANATAPAPGVVQLRTSRTLQD
jgi:23S rRNA (adenine2503-C2)-methyltransferase